MNMSELVTDIKLNLGLGVIHTVFEDIDGTITSIIQNTTIPVFSQYHPYKQEMVLDTTKLDVLYKDVSSKCFRLPFNEKTRKLLYVYDVEYDSSTMNGIGYYGAGLPFMGNANCIQQMMMASANAQLASITIPRMTFKFEHPNKLWIYESYSSQQLRCKFGFEHDKNLGTLAPNGEDRSFFNLAELDVMMKLYPTMKHYTSINSAYSTIDLKIDDWADARGRRDDLLEKWEDTYHFDTIPFYYA